MPSNLQFLIWEPLIIGTCELLSKPTPCCQISPQHWPSLVPEPLPVMGVCEDFIYHFTFTRLQCFSSVVDGLLSLSHLGPY